MAFIFLGFGYSSQYILQFHFSENFIISIFRQLNEIPLCSVSHFYYPLISGSDVNQKYYMVKAQLTDPWADLQKYDLVENPVRRALETLVFWIVTVNSVQFL